MTKAMTMTRYRNYAEVVMLLRVMFSEFNFKKNKNNIVIV